MEWSKKFRFSSKSFYKKELYLEGFKNMEKETGFVKNNKNFMLLQLIMG